MSIAASDIIVSPSILSANLLILEQELRAVEEAGAGWHHIDVMDGHFVPNLTFGLPLIKAIKKISRLPLDVHIMISNPDDTALEYVKAGADFLAFHVEASKDPVALAQAINKAGAKAGVALKPATPLATVVGMLPYISIINVMSVNPGFSGQSFMDGSTEKVAAVAAEIKKQKREGAITIEVDGGINEVTGLAVVRAGARALVAGNYVYAAPDRRERIHILKSLASKS